MRKRLSISSTTTATMSSPIKTPCLSSRKSICFFFVILMASLLTVCLILVFSSLSPPPTSARHHLKPIKPSQPQPPSPPPLPSPSATFPPPPEIKQACKATRHPQLCETTIIDSPHMTPTPKPTQIIQSALWVCSQNLITAQSKIQAILDASHGNINRTNAAKNCQELLHYMDYRISSTMDVIPDRIKDGRAWISAALLYNYACWSSLKYVNGTKLVDETMLFMDSFINTTSNALSMMVSYDLFGDDFDSWKPPATERSGFWEDDAGGKPHDLVVGFKAGFPSKVDVTVCKDEGKGCLQTVQEAVDKAPENLTGDKKFVIRINQGVYEETVRVPLEKKNVVFLGDGIGKTVITGSIHVGPPGITTYNTATVGVNGDGFMARDITFENTAGPDAHQAVALRSDSDLSIFENCEFLGNQDTLYADSLRQFYNSCRIQGNVDFIFGMSAAVFQDCQILIGPRQLNPEKGENNAVTAHGRIDPAQSTGFVFQNCVINGTEEYMKLYHSKPKAHKNYLGRPWKEYSRTVLINCYLDELITSEGWMPWSGDFALSTLYYGEFENKGPGANTTSRVPWSSQIPKEHVSSYSLQGFIQGNEWIKSSS